MKELKISISFTHHQINIAKPRCKVAPQSPAGSSRGSEAALPEINARNGIASATIRACARGPLASLFLAHGRQAKSRMRFRLAEGLFLWWWLLWPPTAALAHAPASVVIPSPPPASRSASSPFVRAVSARACAERPRLAPCVFFPPSGPLGTERRMRGAHREGAVPLGGSNGSATATGLPSGAAAAAERRRTTPPAPLPQPPRGPLNRRRRRPRPGRAAELRCPRTSSLCSAPTSTSSPRSPSTPRVSPAPRNARRQRRAEAGGHSARGAPYRAAVTRTAPPPGPGRLASP